MNTPHTEGMVSWKLKETMDAHGITRYALQKETGTAMNTLRAMYDGSTRRPDLDILDGVIRALRQLTGKPLELSDVLEWRA